jgi:putative transcriptional regulator
MWFRQRRVRRGYSQKDLATIFGVSPATIHGFEHGRTNPSIALARKIAQFFDMSVGDVLTDKDKIPPDHLK